MYLFLKFEVLEYGGKSTFLYRCISGACHTSNTLPPMDDSFQYAPLTSDGPQPIAVQQVPDSHCEPNEAAYASLEVT